MNTIQPSRSCLYGGLCLALLAGCLAAGLAATHAAPPSLQLHPLGRGNWPALPRGGQATDVKVVGNYAYVALGSAGLAVFDVKLSEKPHKYYRVRQP